MEDILFKLEIPTINLNKNIYPIDSPLNNIEKNVEILKYSNIENNFIILASHSGNNSNTYFNNIVNLNNEDIIYLKTKEKTIKYKVNKKYYIEKTGYLNISTNQMNILLLITCSRNNINKQLIIEAIMI